MTYLLSRTAQITALCSPDDSNGSSAGTAQASRSGGNHLGQSLLFEAFLRLHHLADHGPTPEAFTFKHRFPPPD